MQPLSNAELASALSELDGWTLKGDKLTKLFKFKDFRQAIAFIVRLAFEAEALNHHPEIENVYNRVRIQLTTHDAGNKVTEKDVELARRIETLR